MMKTFKCFLIFIAVLVSFGAAAEEYRFRTPDGFNVSLQVCADDIFRVRITAADQFPESLMERYSLIRTDWENVRSDFSENESSATLSSSSHILRFDKNNMSLSVLRKNGDPVIDSIKYLPPSDTRIKTMGDMLDEKYEWCKVKKAILGDLEGETVLVRTNDVGDVSKNSLLGFSLKDGERFYGGGNASHEHVQHRGEILRIWSKANYAGMPVPFLMSSDGWAVYNNTTVRNYFDVGVTEKDRLWIYNTQPDFDFYLIMGDDMLDALDLYTRITGRATMLPNWAYGITFAGIKIENLIDIMNDALRFRDEEIPMDMIWVEPQWMSKQYDYSTAKDWDYDKVFAVPFYASKTRNECNNLLTGRLHEMGYHLALWLCVNTDHSVDEEDDIAMRTGGQMSGQEHWFDHLTRFIAQGVDGFKLDPGRTAAEHHKRQYYNGRSDSEMHNLNQVIMPKRMQLTFRDFTGGRRSFHHYCGGWAGTQRWTASTCGDIGGGVMALYDLVNLSCSGFISTSCDALSFDHVTEMQALHFDSLIPWMEINSWIMLMQPWYYSKENKASYVDYLRLRHSLYPYLYSAALRGSLTARPAMMAMPLAFPDDRNVDDMVDEYMLGDNLLVGVFDDEIYLPDGKWIDYWTGNEYEGDGTTRKIGIPSNRHGHLFIRKGAIIPYQRQMQYIGEYPLDTLILKVYPEGESTYTLYEDDGVTYAYEEGKVARTRFDCARNEKDIVFTVRGREGSYDRVFESRTYELSFNGVCKPSKVMVNGEKMKDWSYEDGVLSLTVCQENTLDEMEIVIR
ncbi:MAG: glycoside hydrolase family 31 protein [Bacteroidales bacterium]|nr:glycoside hydrolase family 31 protein [Bacteroidales bacterium]